MSDSVYPVCYNYNVKGNYRGAWEKIKKFKEEKLMACEEGSLRFILDDGYEEAFVNCYNKIMAENEAWFEKQADNKLTAEDLSETLDIWCRFEDPFNPCLCKVCMAFAIDNPDTYVHVRYDVSWDNSEDDLHETILYRNGFLEDYKKYNGEDSWEKTTLYKLCDGKFVECDEDEE